jgi:hypothetical protein
MNATLIDILTAPLAYSEDWAVYAERINGEFKPKSAARIERKHLGQNSEDGFEYLASAATVLDFYCACFGLPASTSWNARKAVRAAKALIDLRNEFDKVDSLHIGTHR